MVCDKEIQSKGEALSELRERRQALITKIRELKSVHDIDPSIFTPEIWFEMAKPAIPCGDGNDRHLNIFELRARLRDERDIDLEEMFNVEKKIFRNNLDLVLAKIEHLQKSLGPESE